MKSGQRRSTTPSHIAFREGDRPMRLHQPQREEVPSAMKGRLALLVLMSLWASCTSSEEPRSSRSKPVAVGQELTAPVENLQGPVLLAATWNSPGSMTTARREHAATLLA